MATNEGSQAIGNVAGLADILSKLFLGSSSTTTKTVDPAVTQQFNQIFQSLAPQLQGQTISEQEMQALVQSILQQSSQAFAPNRVAQSAAGSYNSTALAQMENDARAKATNDTLATIINAKLQNAATQQNAAQIASGAAGQLGQLTGSAKAVTPPTLGALANPLALYAGYKYLTNGGEAAAAGAASAGASAVPASSSSLVMQPGGTPQAFQSAIPTVSQAPTAVSDLFGDSGSIDLFGDTGGGLDAILSGSGALSSTPAITAPATAGTGAGGAAASSGAGFFDSTSFGDMFSTAAPYLPALGYAAAGDLRGAAGSAVGSYFAGPLGSLVGGLLGDKAIGASEQFLGKVGDTFGISHTDSERLDPIAYITDPNVSDMDKLNASAVAFDPLLGAIGKKADINWVDPLGLFDDCFITTAVMKAMATSGQPFQDDCKELQDARKFRDTFMQETSERRELVKQYYAEAPQIVSLISQLEFADEIFTGLYTDFLVPCLEAMNSGENEAALHIYRCMFEVARASASAAAQEI